MVLFNDKMHAAMIDIDGILKDLVKENTDALIKAMMSMDRLDIRLRGKCVLAINRLNMYFIKTGLLPTNKFMQDLLLLIYSVLLLKNYHVFKDVYFKSYNKENIWFDGTESKIKDIYNQNTNIYLVTKNAQNKSITNNSSIRWNMQCLVLEKGKRSKYHLYKNLMDKLELPNDKVVIIGDNFWDDILPAIRLKTNAIWCDMYNCKMKKWAISILRVFNKRVKLCDSIENI